jgi:hypothetical protein
MNNTENKTTQNIEHLHKYSLMDYPPRDMKSIKVLIKDDFACKCHKVPHSIVPTAIEGQYSKEYEVCSTHCTRAQLIKSEDKLFFFQTCEAIPNKFLIDNAEAKPKSTLEVLK